MIFQIKQKMLLLAAIPLAAMLVLGILSLFNFQSINQGVTRIYDDRVVPMRQLKMIADSYAVMVIDAVNKLDNDLIQVSEASRLVNDANQMIKDNWQAYGSTQMTRDEERLAEEAKALFIIADSAIARLQQELRQNTPDMTSFNGPLYAQIDPISEKISELIELQLNVASTERQHAQALYSSSQATFIGLLVIVIALVGSFSFVFAKTTSQRLSRLQSSIVYAQNSGDLTQPIDIAGNDELAQLAQAYSALQHDFNHIIIQVKETSDALQIEARRLNSVSEMANASAIQQQSQTDLVATASTQMLSSVAGVADSAQQAATAANEANLDVDRGSKIMTESVASFDQLAKSLEETSGIVRHVVDDSSAIGSVLDVIKSVAEQTNLLALNAAIEAARAGEQGRGFAVVADEVRTLAKRTQDSTLEIEEVVGRLQNDTGKAVASMQDVQGQMADVQEENKQAAKVLTEVHNSIDTISAMNQQIAQATDEQTSVSEEINQNIVNIADASRSTAEALADIESSSNQLSGMADNATSLVAKFK